MVLGLSCDDFTDDERRHHKEECYENDDGLVEEIHYQAQAQPGNHERESPGDWVDENVRIVRDRQSGELSFDCTIHNVDADLHAECDVFDTYASETDKIGRFISS